MFSPLLVLAALFLYILDRADTLRRGTGPLPPEAHPPPPLTDTTSAEPTGGDLLPASEYEESDAESQEEEEEETGTETELPVPAPEDNTGIPTPHLVPAAPQPHDRIPRTRTVGAKKARSLARRDQRRAYYEFLQSQQSERARAAAATAEEEEERLFEEKRRRALVEEEIAAKREKERLERIEADRVREEERRRDVGRVKGVVTGGGRKAWRVQELAEMVGRDEGWVREVLRVEGLVGGRQGEWRMLTGEGWYVIIGEGELKVLYGELERKGRMEWREMARVLEEAVA